MVDGSVIVVFFIQLFVAMSIIHIGNMIYKL
jgi:hypothetical protein